MLTFPVGWAGHAACLPACVTFVCFYLSCFFFFFSGLAGSEQLERGVLHGVPGVLPQEHQQAGAAISGCDEVGHVHLEQPLRQVLFRPSVPDGEGRFPASLQSRPSGKNKQQKGGACGGRDGKAWVKKNLMKLQPTAVEPFFIPPKLNMVFVFLIDEILNQSINQSPSDLKQNYREPVF